MRIDGTILMLALLAVSCVHDDKPDPKPDPVVVIATVDEMNMEEEPADSHEGEEMYSLLEPMAEYSILVPSSELGCSTPVYSRIKKMHNGNFLMMYQNAQIGSNIYCNISSDLFSWGRSAYLFLQNSITSSVGSDQRRYSSADAVVLSNGDVLACVAARANKAYSKNPADNYIAMKRSTDNGETWGEEQFIYNGTTWEPYLLQLPSGKIQCYFTDTDPSKGRGNSGTSIVESEDNGYTWSPNGLSNCYKVIRQYKYMYEGTRIYTDQMASVRMLNDGHTLLGFMEARLEEPANNEGTSTYKLSVVRGYDEFKHLGEGEVGPEDRNTNVLKGAAGYVSQFHSGETVLSTNISNIFKVKLGDCHGRNFQGGDNWTSKWLEVLPEKGYWGSTEVISGHEIIGTMHCSKGIQIQKLYLNHRIDAPKCNITLDGDNREWEHTQAWFIGSNDAAIQTCIRAAQDDSNLYFIFDRRDPYLNTGDDISLYISGSDKISTSAICAVVGVDGSVSSKSYNAGSWALQDDARGITAAVTLVGTLDDTKPDSGYVAEVAVPKSLLPQTEDGYQRVMVIVHNGKSQDTFTWASNVVPSGWMLLKM